MEIYTKEHYKTYDIQTDSYIEEINQILLNNKITIQTLDIVYSLFGYTRENANDLLYYATGYRWLEQYKESEK